LRLDAGRSCFAVRLEHDPLAIRRPPRRARLPVGIEIAGSRCSGFQRHRLHRIFRSVHEPYIILVLIVGSPALSVLPGEDDKIGIDRVDARHSRPKARTCQRCRDDRSVGLDLRRVRRRDRGGLVIHHRQPIRRREPSWVDHSLGLQQQRWVNSIVTDDPDAPGYCRRRAVPYSRTSPDVSTS
jgi:hypothetical protein